MKSLFKYLTILSILFLFPFLAFAPPPVGGSGPIGGAGGLASDGNIARSDFNDDTTGDIIISEANILANNYFTNQGSTGEGDFQLPAVSYYVRVIFIVTEARNIEINPPAGEILDLDGVNLDADDCVDSDSTVGSKIVALRMQIADASWRWSLDTIRGVWTDTGASD